MLVYPPYLMPAEEAEAPSVPVDYWTEEYEAQLDELVADYNDYSD